MIHLLRSRATRQQLEEMLDALEVFVKLAVISGVVLLREGVRFTPIAKQHCWRTGAGRKIFGEPTGFRQRSRRATRR